MLKNAWATLSPSIKNIINEAGFALSLKLCLIRRHMNTKIFSNFLPWQRAFGTLHVPSIFQALGR